MRLPIADQQLAYLNIPLDQRGEMPIETAPKVNLTAEFAGRKQAWSGHLARTEAQIDPGSRMVYAIARVRADDENIAAPPVGLFVQAEIEGIAEDNIVVLPRISLRNGNQVLVVDTENRIHFREIEILRVYRDDVYVSAGLNAGELVSVSLDAYRGDIVFRVISKDDRYRLLYSLDDARGLYQQTEDRASTRVHCHRHDARGRCGEISRRAL